MGSSVSASRVGALRRRWEEADKIIDGEREEELELDRDVWSLSKFHFMTAVIIIQAASARSV